MQFGFRGGKFTGEFAALLLQFRYLLGGGYFSFFKFVEAIFQKLDALKLLLDLALYGDKRIVGTVDIAFGLHDLTAQLAHEGIAFCKLSNDDGEIFLQAAVDGVFLLRCVF